MKNAQINQSDSQTDLKTGLLGHINLNKVILSGFLLFILAVLFLVLFYNPAEQLTLTKAFWEKISEFSLLTASVICWFRYFKVHSKFFLWCALWLSALYIRDLHMFQLHIPYFSSVPYYILIFGCFFYGWPYRREIIKKLSVKTYFLPLWIGTFFLYVTAYMWDHGVLHHIITGYGDSVHHFEDYLEEASEALGSFSLLISFLLAR